MLIQMILHGLIFSLVIVLGSVCWISRRRKKDQLQIKAYEATLIRNKNPALQRLFNAIEKNDLLELKNSLAEKVDLDCEGEFIVNEHLYFTHPLLRALSLGHHQVAQLLIQSGAKLDVMDSWGQTPLHLAAEKGFLDVVQQVLNTTDIDINQKAHLYQRTPLHHAALTGQRDIASFLIQEGARINKITDQNETALHLAARRGYVSEYGRISRRYRPSQYLEFIQLLIAHQALINLSDFNGYTPLHYAIAYALPGTVPEAEQVEVIKCLIKHGANPHAQNVEGKTPFQLALHRDLRLSIFL